MNLAKRINQIEKKVSQKIDEMTLKNIEELNNETYEFYQPYIEKINRIVEEVYSHVYMNQTDFETYVNELVEATKPFQEDERDDILLKFSEEAVLRNKQILVDALDEMVNEIINQRIYITQNRLNLEYRKIQNTAISRVQRFYNLNYSEICEELRSISRFGHDSLIAYASSNRVITEETKIEEIEIEVIDYEESNQYIKMTDFHQVTDWLESQGYREVRVVGSHHIYKNGSHSVPVPLHKGKDFNRFLAYQIQKEVYQVC
jgi:predicted RNA binding protein YcfA (HicA-like mRNA interferase family)